MPSQNLPVFSVVLVSIDLALLFLLILYDFVAMIPFLNNIFESNFYILIFLGRSCDTFALSASSSDCLPGHYCTNQSTLRSPVAIYASDYVASPDPATPDAGIPNFFI